MTHTDGGGMTQTYGRGVSQTDFEAFSVGQFVGLGEYLISKGRKKMSGTNYRQLTIICSDNKKI